jgi:alkylated DNA repair dioxygenase AlkB
MQTSPSKMPAPDLVDLMQDPGTGMASGPPGFLYQREAVEKRDEKHYVALFQGLPFQPFDFHGFKGNRRIVSYGWRYDYGVQRIRPAEALPAWLEPLQQVAARLMGVAASELRHALVTEYAPGAGIGWHRDKPMFERVAAFSFLAPCPLRFRLRQDKAWLRHTILVQPRSLYVLSGAARESWEHSIAPLDAPRYSVTFRNFRPDAKIPV